MYIGPWQEYKLAHVLQLKNDVYEGSFLPKVQREKRQKIQEISQNSTPSNVSMASNSLQRAYPSFNLDLYHERWTKLQRLISKNQVKTTRKPKVPIQRRRDTLGLQLQRINKMKAMYGLKDNKINVSLPPINRKKDTDDDIDHLIQWANDLPNID